MTMKDIADLRINQLEELLEGMSENAEQMEREIKGESTEVYEGGDAIKELMKMR